MTKLYRYATFYLLLAAMLWLTNCQNELALEPASTTTPASALTPTAGLPNAAPTTVEDPGRAASPAPTSSPTAPASPMDAPLPTPSPTPAEALPTATPTPEQPVVTVEVDLNVRAGPGTNYERLGLLAAGSTAAIIGRTEDGSWWQIIYPAAPDGRGWIAAGYGAASNAESAPAAVIPPTPIPPTPAPPTATPAPTVPPIDFVIVKQRLWSNEENGGFSPNGSVNNCGYGHEIYVTVVDAAGNPLDGVTISDTYNNPRQISGSIGPGRAQYLLYFNGYNLFVAEDPSAGRPVTSEISHVLSGKDEEIPIPWLIEAHYCANEGECVERIGRNSLCRGHYSYDLVFQRQW